MTTTARPLPELVEDGWARALAPVADQVGRMGQFLREEIAEGRSYLPAGPNVLRAFTYPFEAVRVLIVGQDPYPTPGHAVGLSFSVAPDVRPLPRSLANIFTEYTADLGYPQPANGDLTPWSQRGVMLLNRVLTVRPGAPASHRGKGWEAVTECAIRALAARDEPMVAILWGRDASTLKPMLDGSGGQERSDSGMGHGGQERSDSGMGHGGQERSDSGIGHSRCVAIESPHPSPLSASRGFFGSRPFSRANQLLAEMGAEPVDWRLP